MWQLEGSKASLQSPQLSFQLDLASPASGFTALQVAFDSSQEFRAVDAVLMQLTLPSNQTRLDDVYVRGDDLVATFAESKDYPCRTQVYWRYAREADHFGIQMIVSVQTSRLDATPGFQIASRVPGPARVLQEGIHIATIAQTELCYAELVDRSNIESSTVHDRQITHHLFQGSLEKGVIRRARLLACFLREASAVEVASRIHKQLLYSAPPLTT